MKIHSPASPCYNFYFPRLDTLAEVEHTAHGVIIRTSRHSFSDERKACFVRELAAEGFIADEYAWCSSGAPEGIRWVVDAAAFMPGAAPIAQTRRFARWLFCSATALWLVLMGGLLMGAPR
jgi:hypothetical protein